MNRLIFAATGLAIAVVASAEDKVITLESLLNEITDYEAVARWPDPPYTCKQASSYDRASKTPDDPKGWFANNDWSQFIRSEDHQGRREWVMLDTDGPGAIVRFWTGGKPATGTIRFYLDGAAEPALAGQMQDLFTGKGIVPTPLAIENPKQAGNLYLPIPYAKHCKITYDEADSKKPERANPQRCYNIEYRTYASGTKVQTFSMDVFEKQKPAISRLWGEFWGDSVVTRNDLLSLVSTNLEPGKVLQESIPGPAAVYILGMELDAANLTAALRSTVLIIECDGEQTVWCPVGDFFGTRVGFNAYGDRRRAVEQGGRMTSGWVMPFQKSCRIAVKNYGKQTVRISKNNAMYGKWEWDARSMHFHANWRQQFPIPTRPYSDWNYITTNGQGVYVGDTLSVLNPVKDWWGEGDEKIWMDGEPFPSHIGTGTEDYYGYAWGDTRLFQGPFASQVRCDGPGNQGHTVVTRTRSLDAIPFTKSLKFDMEVWHWKDCNVGYAVTTYWYARPGATHNRPPMPEEATREIPALPAPFKIAGATECETMQVVAKSEGLPVETQAHALTTGDWSVDSQLFVRGRKVGDFIELRIPAPAKRKLTLYATKSWDYGILRLSINGQPAGKDYDAYNATAIPSGPIDLGVFEPKDGQFILRVEVVGANPASNETKSYFGLDAVTLTKP